MKFWKILKFSKFLNFEKSLENFEILKFVAMFHTLYHIFIQESIQGRGTIKGRGMIKDRGMIKGRGTVKGRHLGLYIKYSKLLYLPLNI